MIDTTLEAVLFAAAGLVFLYFGAEWMVRAAAALAERTGISRRVVGLTVVAFGTSTPELSVSVLASFEGSADVALANVVGSNIANIGLILGLVGLLQTVKVRVALVRFDMPVMIWTTVLLLFMLIDRSIGRMEGLLLVALLLIYTARLLTRKEDSGTGEGSDEPAGGWSTRPGWQLLLITAGGIALMVAGATGLVEGSIFLARTAGISEAVIGLTLVAVGTSLPELAASIVAALRREADISLGNLIGSNIFNILFVAGLSACVTPIRPQELGLFDLGVMLFFAVTPLLFVWKNLEINRMHGIVLLGAYLLYILRLFVS